MARRRKRSVLKVCLDSCPRATTSREIHAATRMGRSIYPIRKAAVRRCKLACHRLYKGVRSAVDYGRKPRR